tara:strand:+ start:6340 stop:6999 length:660 start_codon:yes stop_codon:yes gene_type:complete
MMEFVKSDFDNLLCNVSDMPIGEIPTVWFSNLLDYHEFSKIESEKVQLNFEEVFRYIVYMYDMNSPFIKIDDLVKRKITAAKYAGFEAKKDGLKMLFSETVKCFLNCEDTSFNKMVIRYCRMQRSRKWSLLIAAEVSYHNCLLQLMEMDQDEDARDTEKKQKILKEAQQTEVMLESMERDMLNGDDNGYLKRDIYDYIEEEADRNLMLTPEQYAIGNKI